MDAKKVTPRTESEPSATSWNPALRSEKAEAPAITAKPPALKQPESSSEKESEEEDEDEDEDEDEEESDEDDEEPTPARTAPIAPAVAANTRKQDDALVEATQALKIHEPAVASQAAPESSDEDVSEEESEEESSDEDPAVPGEHPADNYEHQGEATALEEAVTESAKVPLVADAASETDDWGNEDDSFDLGGPQEPPLQTPRAEAVGTTVGDQVIGNTAVGGNAGDGLDWGNTGEEEDFFGGAASQVTEAAPSSIESPGAHVEASATKPAQNEWDLDLDLDDDFLEEQEAPVLELSDDEGFLQDEPAVPAAASAPKTANRYAPPAAQASPATSNPSPYAPQSQFANIPQPLQQKSVPSPIAPYGGYGQNIAYQQQQQARPAMASSAQSFADKAKGGYASPYDMPDDIVTTRRRPAPRTSLPAAQPTPPPPRTSSMSSSAGPPRPLHPSNMSAASLSPPTSSQSMQGQMTGLPGSIPPKAAPSAKPASSDFFAELPITSKPKPPGRYTPQQTMPAQSPNLQGPPQFPPKERTASWSSLRNEVHPDAIGAQPQLRGPEQLPMFPSQPSVPTRQNSLPIPQTATAPPSRYSPAPPSSGPAANARYSPAPPLTQGPTNSRYSPAPPGSQGSTHARYVSEPPAGPPRPPSQTYAPRTSSPLAFHTTPHQQSQPVSESYAQQNQGHQVSQSVDALPRAPFRSPLEGVSESEELSAAYSSTPPATARSETPPLRSSPSSTIGSPRKKGDYTPHYQPSSHAAPLRSLAQSPATSTNPSVAPYGGMPAAASFGAQIVNSSSINAIPHKRQASINYEAILPDDERASDPLQRWKGYPIFTWGLGGTVVTSFPKQIPRYGGGMTAPMVKCSPGEVKLQSIKEVFPLADDATKFPGPLKGKNKKKDVQAWLTKRIEAFEQRLREPSLEHSMSLEESRQLEDKALLVKLLQLLVESDGHLEGEVAEAAVKKLFSPPGEDAIADQGSLSTGADIVGRSRSNTANLQAEPIDPRAVEDLQLMLSKGEREKAVWHAVDQRLWGHAMLLSSTLTKDVWKQVVQEFVRKEIKKVGRNNQALAVLYEVFAGNHEDCVDELVPASARAGFQMMSTDGAGAAQDAQQSLSKWRETVALILNNRSEGDASALLSLGRLLAQYGRVEAAHICFIFARNVVRLGGIDDTQSDLVLLGIDHKQHTLELGQDLDPILLTEVYEFALSLSAPGGAYTMPHLQNYKLVHAYQLAEYGYRSDAQAYCDAIAVTAAAITKKSPYYNAAFILTLEDLSKRLSKSPKDNTSSWISKPSMDRVGTSLLSKFNNFIAGDDDENAGKMAGAEVGPFAKVAGNSPTVTPSQSSADLYGAYSGYGMPAQPAAANNSRYAPSNSYTPRTSSEQGRSRYEPQGRPSMESLDGQRAVSETYMPVTPGAGPYSPSHQLSPQRQSKTQTYSPLRAEHNAIQPQFNTPYLPNPPVDESASAPPFGVYQPPSSSFDAAATPADSQGSFNSYAPSANTFDAPAYQPYNPDDDDDDDDKKDQPRKKKSFMDDDDEDDIAARAAALKGNSSSKSEADRKADEAFRKAAEEDAKRDKEGAAKKAGWFGGWFKKDPNAAPGPIKAKLGEESSFFYDPDLGKWVNKKGGADDSAGKPSATPPPPKGPPTGARSASGGTPMGTGPPVGLMKPPTSVPMRSSSMPPPMAAPGSRASTPGLLSDAEGPKPPVLARPSFSAGSGPPSRPGTSMSNASSIDDLLGAPQARKGAGAKKKKGGRYVDVFPQGQAS